VAIPSITQTIRDPGLPASPASITNFLYIGCAQQGSTTALGAFSNASDVIDTYGQGPLSEDLCYHLAIAGGPVYGLRSASSVAGSNGSVTPVRISTSTGTVAITGTALDSYEGRVRIDVTGALGVAQFSYSLDNGRTYSPQLIVPSGGSYVMPDSGLTLGFTAGAGPIILEKGDMFTFATVEPSFNGTDLGAAFTVVKADNTPIAATILSGQFATSSTAATIAAALSTQAQSLFQLYRPVRTMMDAGNDVVATTKTSFAAFVSERVSLNYGRCVCTSGKPITGRSAPTCSVTRPLAARAAESLISTDLAWYSAGALRGVQSITHNEYLSELMDVDGYSTLRTHQGIPGFFPTNVRLKSLPGSDYKFWQHGRVMDVATANAYVSLLPFLSSSVRTTSTGAIDPRDAAIWEAKVYDTLRTALMDPDNAQGYPGHVSALEAIVDKTSNVLTSGVVKVKVAIRPLGYAKTIVNELSFAANVGG
jgi:hypothetical protein